MKIKMLKTTPGAYPNGHSIFKFQKGREYDSNKNEITESLCDVFVFGMKVAEVIENTIDTFKVVRKSESVAPMNKSTKPPEDKRVLTEDLIKEPEEKSKKKKKQRRQY